MNGFEIQRLIPVSLLWIIALRVLSVCYLTLQPGYTWLKTMSDMWICSTFQKDPGKLCISAAHRPHSTAAFLLVHCEDETTVKPQPCLWISTDSPDWRLPPRLLQHWLTAF